MGGAGQWTLDHRRSLTRHRKQEEEEDKEERKEEKEQKEKAFQGRARESSRK